MKNHNPNSWSELPLDLLILVFKRLSFANFQRAKSVCSSWYSAWRQSVPKNQIPWLILFPEDNSSCMLLNPEEKDRLYKTKDLGAEFANHTCIATYGSWLLMGDSKYNLYILNLFTHERIYDLPALESQKIDMVKVERSKRDGIITVDRGNVKTSYHGIMSPVRNPVFWIDEKTKDYVVLWGLGGWWVVYCKKGDKLWNHIPEISNPLDMVYKDHKLYSLTRKLFTILDFSGEIPQQTFQSSILMYGSEYDWLLSLSPQLSDSWCVCETKLVVTVTGDYLVVQRMVRRESSSIQSFNVYKLDLSGTYIHKDYEQVFSLGDEAILLNLGITVLANEIEGLDRGCIYFSDCPVTSDMTNKALFLFNLETQTMERLHKFDFDCYLSKLSARWFLPNFSHT